MVKKPSYLKTKIVGEIDHEVPPAKIKVPPKCSVNTCLVSSLLARLGNYALNTSSTRVSFYKTACAFMPMRGLVLGPGKQTNIGHHEYLSEYNTRVRARK